ncbi:MAG: cobalamin biosynthesis protein [Acidimicrobiia bacterium]
MNPFAPDRSASARSRNSSFSEPAGSDTRDRSNDQRRPPDVFGVSAAIGTGLALRAVLSRPVTTTVATTICVAGRMLDTEARSMAPLLEGDQLAEARIAVRSLVGRTMDELDSADLSRPVVESFVENGVDAVTSSRRHSAGWDVPCGRATARVHHDHDLERTACSIEDGSVPSAT